MIAPLLIVLLGAALACATAVWPVTGGVLATLLGVSGATAAMVRGVRVPAPVWPLMAVPGVAITALWPTAGFVVALVIGVTVLAIRAPVYAYLGALALLGFEGSIKLRLSVEGAPSPLAVGAALIDIALVVAVVGLLADGRTRDLRRLWASFGRAERLITAALVGWLVLSVLQIPLGDSLANGVEGFRLVQFYVPALLGGVLLAARVPPERLVPMLLGLILVIAAYAAFRGIVGSTDNERRFAEERATGTILGEQVRDTGSFTSPVALASFMVPASIFALVIGVLVPIRRIFAGVDFGLAMIGVVASYVRTALVAVVAGALALAGLLIGGAGVTWQRRFSAVALAVLVLGGGYGATLIAGEADPVAAHRAETLANPFTDYSVRTRLKTWNRSLDKLVHQPLGTGVGTIGRATIKRGRDAVYTDNSYLKILQEQGFPGGILFLFAVLGAVVVVLRRLARAGPLSRPLGAAAVVAFSAFLVLCLMGEYIEQPGKGFAWTLLGIATWEAYGR